MIEWRRHLYSVLFYLLLPFMLLRLWWRGRVAPGYRQGVGARLGFMGNLHFKQRPLWIHAVSVGETIAIAPFVERFLAENPNIPVVMTSMTPTGAARAKDIFGERITHLFCPYDLPCAMTRFVKAINPCGLLVVETELWPNMIATCARKQIPIVIANARLSVRSAKGYRRFKKLAESMLSKLSLLVAQHQDDADRFVELGLPEERCIVSGSIKFDITVPSQILDQGEKLRAQLGDRPTLILASSHEGEERLFLDLLVDMKEQCPNLLVMLVPRHPERFTAVWQLCHEYSQRVVRCSDDDSVSNDCDIYLGDTMGQLMRFYAAADIAVMGGSFIKVGGHNPVEPACLGLPVVMGPYHYNFQAISEQMQKSGGMVIVDSKDELKTQLLSLLSNPNEALKIGEKAALFAASQRGALERLYAEVLKQLKD